MVRMMNDAQEAVNGGRVQSVQRAAALLEAIAEAPEPQTAPDLAERCGLNRSTAWRILATLEDEGLVERDAATNRYSIGHAVARLTSTGTALLAWLPSEELEAVIAQPLPRFTDSTITELGKLRQEMERVRRRGYAVSRGELEGGLWGVSAPVLDRRGRPIAVVSVWGAEGRLRAHGLDDLGRATA